LELNRQNHYRNSSRRDRLVRLLGGEKPCLDFTFERFQVDDGNRLAFERARSFDPTHDNLYLWGPCGVGKTHLGSAVARRCFDETLSVELLRPWQLSRRTRMKEPADEEAAINEIVDAEVLVFDDLGTGTASEYHRQTLQEVLDGRTSRHRAGLLVTSKYSLDQLAAKFGEDTIPSRLAGLCEVIGIKGTDHRLRQAAVLFRTSPPRLDPPRDGGCI
jgi:DNA replication protein DnaC